MLYLEIIIEKTVISLHLTERFCARIVFYRLFIFSIKYIGLWIIWHLRSMWKSAWKSQKSLICLVQLWGETQCCKKAIDIALEAGDRLEEGRGRIAHGIYNLQKKNRDLIKAEESFKESVKNFENIEAKSGLCMSYYNLGIICNESDRKKRIDSLSF